MRPRLWFILIVSIILFLSAGPSGAGDGEAFDQSLLLVDSSGKLLIADRGGAALWEMKAPSTHDAWVLDNGNVLFAWTRGGKAGVREVRLDKSVAMEYETSGEVFSCQRLEGGVTLVGECTNERLVEIDHKGVVIKTIPVLSDAHGHSFMRTVRKRANGRYLVCHLGESVLREYFGDGRLARERETESPIFSAVELDNGNLLCGCLDRVVEWNDRWDPVWSMTLSEMLTFVADGADVDMTKKKSLLTGVTRLSNGNTVVANYYGHGASALLGPVIEVSPDKKVVWQFPDRAGTKAVIGVQALIMAPRALSAQR